MSNRKLAFGYMMEMGEVFIHPEESETVRFIFQQYINGRSYSELVDELKKRPTAYDSDKPWNKNMVARILEDSRYIGKKGYPPILEAETMTTARAIRQQRRRIVKKTDTQKMLRRLSGYTATQEIEEQVLDMLNSLAEHPERIQQPELPPPDPSAVMRLRRRVEEEKNKQPIDQTAALEGIILLAILQFEQIGQLGYETEKLRWKLMQRLPAEELDAGLLKSTVAAIEIKRGKVVSIRLKNEQVFYWGDLK